MGKSDRIGRSVRENTCHCVILAKDNTMTRQDVVLYGDYRNETRMNNAVRRKLPKGTRFLVEKMDTREFFASMPIDKFLRDADRTDTQHRKPKGQVAISK